MNTVIVFLAKYLIFVIVALTVLAGYTSQKRRKILVSMIIAIVLALDLALIADALYYNPRPFVSSNIKPLIPHEPDNGFPSMHTVLAMTLASVVYFYHRHVSSGSSLRRWLAITMFALTLLVGAGRVWAHVHSWIDIAGGLTIGAIAGYAGVKIPQFLFAWFSAKQPKARH